MTTRKDKIAANEAALKAAAAALTPSKDDVEQAERLLEEIGKNAVGLDSVEKLTQVEKLLGLAGVSAEETQDAIKEVAKKRTRKVAATTAQEVTDVVAKKSTLPQATTPLPSASVDSEPTTASPTPAPTPGLLSRIGSALTGKTAQHLAMAFTGGLVGGALGIIGTAELAKRQSAASAQKSLSYVEL